MWWTLYYAIRKNDIPKVEEILKGNPELAHQKGTGIHQNDLLLHISTAENHTEVSQLLISKMCEKDLCAYDMFDRTAIYYAAKKGNLELCQLLFERAPGSIYKTDCFGHTPLVAAAEHKHVQVCYFFLDQVNDNYIATREILGQRYNFLHYATINGLTGALKKIIKKYPNLISNQPPDSFKKNLLDLAAENGQTEVCELFIAEYPFFITKNSESIYKTLSLAAGKQHLDTCQMFIKKFPNNLNVIEPFYLPKKLTFKMDDLDDVKDYLELKEKCSQFISEGFYCSKNITLYLSDHLTAWNFILKTCPQLICKNGYLDNTLLHSAARSGHADICKLLLRELI